MDSSRRGEAATVAVFVKGSEKQDPGPLASIGGIPGHTPALYDGCPWDVKAREPAAGTVFVNPGAFRSLARSDRM
jgi:hypothetical protein